MKVCFFGLGSIGRRHFRNLRALAAQKGIPLEVHALRTSEARSPDEPDRVVHDPSDLDDDYDFLVISNPTACHHPTLAAHLGRGRGAFIEKPLFHRSDLGLSSLPWKKEGTYHVACPLRYHPLVRALASGALGDEKILSLRLLCSSYLPDWRPGDYRRSYSARGELGGGVGLDLIHEWDYLAFLFGLPLDVLALRRRVSSLEISTDDVALYLADFGSFVAEIHLDYFGPFPRRTVEIITEEELWVGDFLEGSLMASRATRRQLFPKEDIYMLEMADFLDRFVTGAAGANLPERALQVLSLAERGWKR